jgi:hypothetical protein
MEHIKSTFEDEVHTEFLNYWKDNKDCDVTYEEIEDNFIEEEYNTNCMTKYECDDFINSNLDVYLEMEQVCMDYYESELGDVWTGRGVVSVVNLWKYLYVCDYLRDNYEAIIKEYEDGVTTDEEDDIPYAPAPPTPVAPEADIEETSAPSA